MRRLRVQPDGIWQVQLLSFKTASHCLCCGLMKSCLPQPIHADAQYRRGDFHLRLIEDVLDDAAYSSSPKNNTFLHPRPFSPITTSLPREAPARALTSPHLWLHFLSVAFGPFPRHTYSSTQFRSFSNTPEYFRAPPQRGRGQYTGAWLLLPSAPNAPGRWTTMCFSLQRPLNSCERTTTEQNIAGFRCYRLRVYSPRCRSPGSIPPVALSCPLKPQKCK